MKPISISERDYILIIGSFYFYFLQAVQAGGETEGGGSTVISWVVDDDNSVVKYCQDNIVTIFVPGSGMEKKFWDWRLLSSWHLFPINVLQNGSQKSDQKEFEVDWLQSSF